MKGLFKIAFSASSFSSPALIPVKGEPQYEEVPCSAWALANVVNLASASGQGTNRSREFGHQFVKDLICEEYVQALCCLLDDLTPWIENENRKHVDHETNELEYASEDKRTHLSPAGELLLNLLRPLNQQWLLLELLNVASKSVADPGANLQKQFGLSEVAKLYSNLLALFSALNSFGGALPVLNILAFTKSVLPQFWGWICDVLKLQEVSGSKMSPQLDKGGVEGSKLSSEKGNKGIGTKWAASLATKIKSKTSGAESSLLECSSETSRHQNLQRWDMDAMKHGPAGVPQSAIPVLSLFCAVYAHLLMVLDDEEFYERQVSSTFVLVQCELVNKEHSHDLYVIRLRII